MTEQNKVIHCEIPKADLDAINELISNYLDVFCSGCSEQSKEQRKMWRPLNERVWRAANGYGYTNHPDMVKEIDKPKAIVRDGN